MSYAGNRVIYDADGHIMELPTHLREFADPDVRELIPLTSYSASSVTEEEERKKEKETTEVRDRNRRRW